jgi:hypothetical protein
MLSPVVMRWRDWTSIVALAGLAACRQLNPDWLGPAGEETAGSESGAATASTESGATSTTEGGEPSTGGSTDVGPLPSQCAPPAVPGEGECPATCSACDGGRCIVDCTATDCSNATVACPEGWPCDFLCVGDGACKRGTLECAPDRDCTVECEGFEACQRGAVICGAGTCAVTCSADQNACHSLEVACGPATSTVTCAGPSNLDLQPAEGSECACEDFGCEG